MPMPDEYCLLWINWWATCQSRSEWASWFQALGAFAAIAAGAFGIYWQVVRQRASEALRVSQSEIRVLQHIGATVFYCYYLLKVSSSESASGGDLAARMADVRRQVDVLARIDLLQIPDWRGAFAVDVVRGAFEEMVSGIDRIQSASVPIGADSMKWRHEFRTPHFNAAEDNLDTAIRIVQATLAERGVKLQPMSLMFKELKVSTDDFPT